MPTLKQTIVAGLILLTIAGITGQARQEAAATQQRESRREQTCRFQWMDRAIWTPREEWRTMVCVLQRWPVFGGSDTFHAVIDCESGWYRLAYNPNGLYVGLAQHGLRYWPGRVNYYMPDAWKVGRWQRWENSRSQIVVTARMVQAQGWGAWTCA